MIRKLVLLGVALFVIGIAGSLLTLKSVTTQAAEPLSKEITYTQTIQNLEVFCDNAHVILKPTTAHQTRVNLTGHMPKNKSYTFNTSVQDQTLHIQLKNKWSGFLDFTSFTQKLTLTVYLPKKTYETLKVLTNNGQVAIQNLSSDTIETTSHNGLLTLTNTTSKTVTAQTNNGKIILDHVVGTLNGHTNNGAIYLNTSNLDQTMTMACDNGKITIQTDHDPTDVRFDVHVDNGHTNILNKYNDSAVIGNGDHVIKLTTNNGSIDVTKSTND